MSTYPKRRKDRSAYASTPTTQSRPRRPAALEVFAPDRPTDPNGLLDYHINRLIASGAPAIIEQPTATVQVERIAREFSRVLREWITDEQMQEVIRRNKAETDTRICHSHDFCDANMAMDAAFRDLGMDPFEGGEHISEATCELWGAAWDVAKSAEFYPPTAPTQS